MNECPTFYGQWMISNGIMNSRIWSKDLKNLVFKDFEIIMSGILSGEWEVELADVWGIMPVITFRKEETIPLITFRRPFFLCWCCCLFLRTNGEFRLFVLLLSNEGSNTTRFFRCSNGELRIASVTTASKLGGFLKVLNGNRSVLLLKSFSLLKILT